MTLPAASIRLLLAPALLAAACSKGPAYGSANSIIAVVDPAIAERVEPILREAFEREVRTTRPEMIFEVTFTTPEGFDEFRRWRRIVVIEPLESATLIPEVVDVSGAGPVVKTVEDEWARGQRVHVLGASGADETVRLVEARVDSLYAEVHAAFAAEQEDRMWASGRDSALFREMRESRGFGLFLPRIYRPAPRSAPDSTLVHYAADPRRVVSIHWAPLPDAVSPDTVLALRRSWGATVFPTEEMEADSAIQVAETRLAGRPAVRLQGVWTDATEAGLFLTYGVPCGGRLILLDGNVFAPDREKYPYIMQLERIFETFECAAGGP